MLEAKIILPLPSDRPCLFDVIKNYDLSYTHKWLEAAIVRNFGGVTVTQGRGSWRDDTGRDVRENVAIYTFAHEATPVCCNVARSLAVSACDKAREECVYYRDHNGNVELVEGDNKP